MAVPDKKKLQRALAGYYTLIMKIDQEIGRVIEHLKASGEYENTIICYVSDHGDFAGEHGLFLKNLGIYESIHRIPFLLKWPGGPREAKCKELMESVDWYATLCDLCKIPQPEQVDGRSLVPVVSGETPGKEHVICEFHNSTAIRTPQYRLVYYADQHEGELYDRDLDPGELHNLWSSPEHSSIRMELLQKVLEYHMAYQRKSDIKQDAVETANTRYAFTPMLHKHRRYYSDLMKAYTEATIWPRKAGAESSPET
jgi:arylsulfatase A-like enzyme